MLELNETTVAQTNYGIIGLGILAYIVIGIFVSTALTALKYMEPHNGFIEGEEEVRAFKFLAVIFWPFIGFIYLWILFLNVILFLFNILSTIFESIIDFLARKGK